MFIHAMRWRIFFSDARRTNGDFFIFFSLSYSRSLGGMPYFLLETRLVHRMFGELSQGTTHFFFICGEREWEKEGREITLMT